MDKDTFSTEKPQTVTTTDEQKHSTTETHTSATTLQSNKTEGTTDVVGYVNTNDILVHNNNNNNEAAAKTTKNNSSSSSNNKSVTSNTEDNRGKHYDANHNFYNTS